VTNVREDQTMTANARSSVYGLLAMIFRAEPAVDFLVQLKTPGFSEILKSLGYSLGDEFKSSPDEELAEDLAVEYARLFIGPGPHLSPHESVHLEVDGYEGGLWGATTVKVKKFIEAAGLNYEDQFTGLPDHISVELEFMQKMTEWEAEKWAEGDEEKALGSQMVQRKFMDEHVMLWGPGFCDKVIDMSESPFYENMAKVAKSFLEFDHKAMTN